MKALPCRMPINWQRGEFSSPLPVSVGRSVPYDLHATFCPQFLGSSYLHTHLSGILPTEAAWSSPEQEAPCTWFCLRSLSRGEKLHISSDKWFGKSLCYRESFGFSCFLPCNSFTTSCVAWFAHLLFIPWRCERSNFKLDSTETENLSTSPRPLGASNHSLWSEEQRVYTETSPLICFGS